SPSYNISATCIEGSYRAQPHRLFTDVSISMKERRASPLAPGQCRYKNLEAICRVSDGAQLRTDFRVEPLSKAAKVNDHALVGPVSDLLDLVMRAHVELDPAAVDLGDYRFGRHAMSDRRCRKMTDIHRGSDRAFVRLQVVPHRVERGILHRRHHHRRGKHRRQRGILKFTGEMGGRDTQRVVAFCSNGDWAHRISPQCVGYG